ncbi:hypothetical protein [Roseobacter sp.]|uniref:hypothetical protein n=1 Tax=Roseobacter sp. TaxID=1907202 RepID=UPI002966ED17|nr:hypothetical protein [Roseobacter sp.]MDW3182097.1 hypothetical protein [Roseobacter sp.]
MTYQNRLKALLSKGYFPKELPPAFTTVDFGQNAYDIMNEWSASKLFTTSQPKYKKKKMRGQYTYTISDTELEVISKPKRNYERRNIHVTHPIPQLLLANEISNEWHSVWKMLQRQTYSLDRIEISEKYERAIKGIGFKLHRVKKDFLEATSDWLVKTDISRFYPTIYTHSLAWAAYGKEKVKKNFSLYKCSLADRLDILVRACNRNQTIGIPIGPETSRILAEIISARIDSDFHHNEKDISRDKVDRLQDDWFIGVETLEAAERALSSINLTYRDYGLEINGYKTSINHILANSGTSWISEIGGFLSHNSKQLSGNRLREFISLSLRLQAEYPNEAVIIYALSVIEGKSYSSSDIEVLETFLLKASVQSPISMDKICRIILNLQFTSQKISAQRICDRFTTLLERNTENGNLYEAMWLLYTIRGLKQPIQSKRFAELLEIIPGSALPLISLDMKSKSLFSTSLPKATWEDSFDYERTRRDWSWLLAYEGIRHGWLQDKKGLMSKSFFKPMHGRQVVFYDPKRNVPSSKSVVEKRKRSQKAQSVNLSRFMFNLRGVEPPDWLNDCD